MKVVVLQSNYIPWRGYFDLIGNADIFCFYDEVKYTKNDWRNRNKIYSKNGLQWLTIPINKEAVKQKISEVELPDNWEQKHISILEMTYGKAPFFFQLEKIIQDIYIGNKHHLLSNFNQNIIKYLCAEFGFKTKFVSSVNYDLRGNRVDRLLNLLNDIGTTEYITGPNAKAYLSGAESLFSHNGINLTYKQYGPYKEYKQLSLPFEPNVSIIDLIANVSCDEIKRYYIN